MREKVISCVVENDRLVLRGFSDTEECLLRRFLQQIIGNINSIRNTQTHNLRKRRI